MKKIYIFLSLLILASCTSLDEMLETEKYEEAFSISCKRLSRGKIKWENLNVLEKSFAQLNQRDLQMIEQMRAKGRAELWPRIHQVATYIASRQAKVTPVLQRVADNYAEPAVRLYPIEELVEEAAENSAIYFYAAATEYLEQARKGNRLLARKAHGYMERCLSYRPYFRDAPSLEEELFELGTTHIQLETLISESNPRLENQLFSQVIGTQLFPFRQGWQLVHFDDPIAPESIHYRIELSVDHLYVSSDHCSSSCCTESAEVEAGTITTLEWSVTDSAWVEVQEVQYETVTATVTTFEQSKSASLKLEYVLVEAQNGLLIDHKFLCRGSEWNHSYSTLSGDERALNSCAHIGGSSGWFPNDQEMLVDAARSVSRVFYSCLEDEVEIEEFAGR